MTNNQLQTVSLSYKVSEETLAKVKQTFKTVYYHPDGEELPADKVAEVNVWATSWRGLPEHVKSLDELKGTKLIQLASGESALYLTSAIRMDVGRPLSDDPGDHGVLQLKLL